MVSCLRMQVFCKYCTLCIVCFACNPFKPIVTKMLFKEMFYQKKPFSLYRVKVYTVYFIPDPKLNFLPIIGFYAYNDEYLNMVFPTLMLCSWVLPSYKY